jgi:hypothetical protein
MQKLNTKSNKKQKKHELVIIPSERVISKIFLIRGKKVMLDRDLAILYGVTAGVLNQAVKRNIKRFPDDFMFRLNKNEAEVWQSEIINPSLESQFVTLNSRSQVVILKRGQNIKYAPSAFTEQGVAMLSSVLRSERAIQVNIQIMRTFTNLREMLTTNKELREKIEKLEKKYDQNFRIIFETIQSFIKEKVKPKNKIGF